LAGKARELYGEATHPLVTAVTTSVPTGSKCLLDGGAHPLADLCAASSAVPGVFAPHRVAGRLHLDGGVRSMASVDAAPVADLLVVVIPFGGRMLSSAGRVGELQLRREIASWRRRSPGADVLVVKPNRRIAALAGPNPMSLFDKPKALEAYELAVEQGRSRAALLGTRVAA
jgi:NTE family protein